MKNIFKRGSIFFLAMVIAVFSVTPAMAAETDNSQNTKLNTSYDVYVEEFILEPGESITEEDLAPAITTLSTINQTFTMGSYHRGADRTYSTSTLRFAITITDTSGKATSSTMSLALLDYNGNAKSWLLKANGTTYVQNNISIVAGRTYYFTYTNYGSVNLKVHMVITNY